MKKTKILKLKDIELNYHTKLGETKAISGMTFDVYENEFLTIVGPSGCGKSTILSIISGLIKPSGGKIESKINGLHADYDQSVGYMLQQDYLFDWRTIFKNTVLGLEIKHQVNKNSKEYVEKLLKKYGLSEFANNYPKELSGGMRQKAALIRTLATDPKILLLDEPFSALDYQTRINISGEIKDIIKNENKTAILVTHDISEAIHLSDRILIFSGRPSHVKKVIDIDKKFKTLTQNQKQKHPLFNTYFDAIWSELNA